MGCPVEWECSARAEVARSHLRTDFGVLKFVALISCWLVLCKSTSNLCRGYSRSPLIFLLQELGPLGVLEVGVMMCLSDKKCLKSLGMIRLT